MMKVADVKAAPLRRPWVCGAIPAAHTQGPAGGGCVRLAALLLLPPTSTIAATSAAMGTMLAMIIMPCAPLCILISQPLAATAMQVQSAVMAVKIIYKKAIKMIITVVKIS